MAVTPLKQECAGQEARALPASLASRRLTKARCLQGGPSRAVRPCVRWGQHWLTPRAVLCPHMVPVVAERLLFASCGPAWRRSGPILRGRSIKFRRRVRVQHIGGAPHGLGGAGVVRGFDNDVVFHDEWLKTVSQPFASGRNVP